MGQLANDFSERPQGSLLSNIETKNQAGGFEKEKCQDVTFRSGRNLTINDPDSECRNSISSSNANNVTLSNVSDLFIIYLTNNASSFQNNDVQINKEVESTRQNEEHGKASN